MTSTPHPKGTTSSAQQIASATEDALRHLMDAQAKVRLALILIKAEENEPEMKVSAFQDIQGALSLSTTALVAQGSTWRDNAAARKRLR